MTSPEHAVASARQRRFERIWAAVCEIPEGQVASYGQIAGLVGLPRGARQVGQALRHLPRSRDVPWHRVVTASGRLAFERDSDAFCRQARRLRAEGVQLVGATVDLRRYRWCPDLDELLWKPTPAWDGSDD